jgi:hypothetical protein
MISRAIEMSLFEFVTVMVSMILALTLGQLLAGTSFLLKSSREVRWYAPHTLWLVTLGLTLINHWWSLWDFHTLDWDYASFLYILIAPVLIALAVGLVAPDRSASGSLDMRQQYAHVRRPFGLLFAAYVLAMWFDGPLLAGHDPLGTIGLLHPPILAGAVLALVTENRTANLIAPVLVFTMMVVVIIVRFRMMS